MPECNHKSYNRNGSCTCSIQAMEPDEKCPVHGVGEYPDRCMKCGQFLPSKNIGILAQIREKNGKVGEVKDKILRDKIKEMFDSEYKNSLTNRNHIWLGHIGLQQFHEFLGDKAFYNMLDSTTITTNSRGAEYIENFLEDCNG